MYPLSACIIAKNEEKNLDSCLRSLKNIVSEIVLVDTGSTDHTQEIAAKYTDKIFSFCWCNDFSAARNYAVSKASNDWIISLDCDEYMKDCDTSVLGDFLCPANQQTIGQFSLQNLLPNGSPQSVQTDIVSRLFHRKYFHFAGSIHEQLVPLDPSYAPKHFRLPITLIHTGYSIPDILTQKAHRNITLLLEALKREESAYLYYQLGQCYYILEAYEQAADYFEKSFQTDNNLSLFYVQNLLIQYGYSLLQLNQASAALQLEQFMEFYSAKPDFLFLMGLIYMNNGMLTAAIDTFQMAARLDNCTLSSEITSMSYYNIAVIYECTGNLDSAREYYKKSGNYAPALKRLSLLSD